MSTVDLSNVQGDILLDGIAKHFQTFFFFKIEDAHVREFCQSLAKVANEIASAEDTRNERKALADWKNQHPNVDGDTMPSVGANISFSWQGLQKMQPDLNDLSLNNTGDQLFQDGMKKTAVSDLNDPPRDGSTDPAWETPFLQSENLHGVILVAGNDANIVQRKLDTLKGILNYPGSNAMVSEVTSVSGKVRPGAEKGHEHFGFEDGISQPGVEGIDPSTNGGGTVKQGVILCGRDGQASTNPPWMQDGSFLAFRKLAQKVPEFNKFLVDASNVLGTWSGQLGARLIGRWPSGCPVTLSPDFDDKTIAADATRVNNFGFDLNDNRKCPIGAHVRKTNPRGDLGSKFPGASVDPFRILRRGIPYGEEVDIDPHGERGLLFVCYQATLHNGFHFLQQTWANSPDFLNTGTGLDAIIGQDNKDATVDMTGLFPQDATRKFPFKGVNQFVVPKGGEYFFSPPMAALRGVLAQVKDGGAKREL